VQVFNDDWNTHVDVENYKNLHDKSKIRCTNINSCTCSPSFSQASLAVLLGSSIHSTPTSRVAAQQGPVSAESLHWPQQFVFPANKLPNQVSIALESSINLNHPTQWYLRGLLVNTLYDEAMIGMRKFLWQKV
jgi:hypothetical protein